MLTAVLLIIMFICIALMWTEGFWGNALTFGNTVFAALIATNYFEPLAGWLDKQMPSFTYMCDFLALWLLFAGGLMILRTTTDQLSRFRVRFKMPVEVTGRILFAVLTSWVFVCFVVTTLHTAPLARTALRGSFEPTMMGTRFLGATPDRYWLAFVHSRSQGALSRSNPNPFDPKGDFIPKYAGRRKAIEDYNKQEGTVRVKK
jgi:hypothetical protein